MDYSKLNGLVPAVVQDADTNEVLMVGFMNAEAFEATVDSQYVTFYSTPAGQKLATTNFTINQQLQRVMQVFTVNLKTEFYAKVRAELKTKGVTL